jgi:sugar phosphate isomerase/epimerase
MRFAFCNEGFGERPWAAVCRTLSAAGYDGVEIAPFTLAEHVGDISQQARAELRGVAAAEGLAIVGLHWLLVKPEGLHISHPDQAVRSRTRDYLCQLTDFCADLGGRVMVFGSPKQRGNSAGATDEEAWKWAIATFRGTLPTLAEREVTLCLEPLGTEETDFVNTAERASRLIAEVGDPHVRLLLDTKAMCSEEKPIEEIVRTHRDILAHFHANDANRRGPGFGDLDFKPILAALQDSEYTGYVSVEPFDFTPDVDTVAAGSLRYLKECEAAALSDESEEPDGRS